MTKVGLVKAPSIGLHRSEPANDGGMPDPTFSSVSGRKISANDNIAHHDLPPCLPVTDEEVTLLHRYLSREILGLFS